MGASVAQKLAGEGHEVHLLTQAGDIADYMDYTLEAPMLHRDLHRLGVEHPHLHDAREDRAGRLPRVQHLGPGPQGQFEVDTVVLCTARISDDELYRELKSDPAGSTQEGIEALYLIGDASAPRMIVDSIFDGHRLAREIDSPHPEMPLPFIRERRLWGETQQRRLPHAAAQHRRCRLAVRGAKRDVRSREDRRPVKQVAALDEEFELLERVGRRSRTSSSGISTSGTRSRSRRRCSCARAPAAAARWSRSPSATRRPRRRCSSCLAQGADRAVRVWDEALAGADAARGRARAGGGGGARVP